MQVSLDGGETWVEAPQGVRVIQQVAVPGEDDPDGELHHNHTDEGLITDVWVTEGEESKNIGTASETHEEIVSRLVEDND